MEFVFILLTKQTAIIVTTGMKKQIRATFRQATKFARMKTMKNPSVAEIPAKAMITPRIDASL